MYAVYLLLTLPQRHLWALTSAYVHWRRENNQNLGALLYTSSELTLVPRNSKCHFGVPIRVGPKTSENKWSFGLSPTHSGPGGYPNTPHDYFSSSEIQSIDPPNYGLRVLQ